MRNLSTVRNNDSQTLPAGVSGTADPRFSAAVNAFGRLFARNRGGGALAVYHHGEPVVDVWAGTSDRDGKTLWDNNTGTVPYSTSKGISATVIHRLADRGLIDYDAPVAEYWPAFAEQGKAAISVRWLLTHRAGLSGLPGIASTVDEILDHRLMEERLAAAKPDRRLGVPSYHSLTYGWLLAGLARSVTGKGMAELFRTEIAEPLGTDGIHLGRPPAESPTKASGFSGSIDVMGRRIAQLVIPAAGRVPGPLNGVVRTIYLPGFESVFAGHNPPILNTELPAGNAVATARGLATLYSAIAMDGESANGRFLSRERIRQLSKVQTRKVDRTLYLPMLWRLGYHSFPMPGAPRMYGHLGMAGSGALADPGSGIAIGFVHNRLPDPRFMMLDQTILSWLAPMVTRAAKAANRERPTVLPLGSTEKAS